MQNIGEFPKDVSVSTLSQILLVKAPQKYYLNPSTCLGILRRASKNGKDLPEELQNALILQSRSV